MEVTPAILYLSIYLYELTLSSSRAVEAHKAALNAVVCSINEQCASEVIEMKFGIWDWVVVL